MFTYSLLENALEKSLGKQKKQLKIKEKNKQKQLKSIGKQTESKKLI